jgi:hypothetical protein
MSVRIAGARKQNPLAPRPEEVHPANRIKWWNIIPGDKVRLVRGPYKDPERVVEVLSVNKFRNLILLKDLTVGLQSLLFIKKNVLTNPHPSTVSRRKRLPRPTCNGCQDTLF